MDSTNSQQLLDQSRIGETTAGPQHAAFDGQFVAEQIRYTAYAVHSDGTRYHIATSFDRSLVDHFVSYHKATMTKIVDQYDWARSVKYVIEEMGA